MDLTLLNQVTDHVYWLAPDQRTDRPTLGVIVGSKATLVVDAGNSPAHAKALLAAMDALNFAGIRDIVGGRSGAYEKEHRAQDIALTELKQRAADMGANAVIGVDLDYETVGQNGSMLMVSASGTAVVI